jgi:hypothetical protein
VSSETGACTCPGGPPPAGAVVRWVTRGCPVHDRLSRAEVAAAARKVADNARPAAKSTYNSYEDCRAAAAVVKAFELFARVIEDSHRVELEEWEERRKYLGDKAGPPPVRR